MRIGIDAHVLGKGIGGVETFLYSIIKALGTIDRTNEYLIYTGDVKSLEGELPDNFTIKRLRVVNPWIERLVEIPRRYQLDGLDAVHVQRVIPPFGCRKTILHLHDAHYRTYPHLFPLWKRLTLDQAFQVSGSRATRILTGTETSREEIIKFYGLDPSRIDVIPNGVDTTSIYRATGPEIDATLTKFRIKQGYVLYVGALERHKNVHVLINAFGEYLRCCPNKTLVLAGKAGRETRRGYAQELTEMVRRLGGEQQVIFTGYVSQEEKRALMSGADMFVFPSVAEGFCMPPLECMACQTPVITTDIPVLREVYQEASLKFPPGDHHQLARQMVRVSTEAGLARALVAKGVGRVKAYPWEQAAARLLASYQKALE